jgi:hypothetical protein
MIAVLWEISEFAADQVLGSNVQRSLNNTMRDLILGLAGASCYAVAATAWRTLQRKARVQSA